MLLASAVLASSGSGAAASAGRPDAHDRTLSAALDSRVAFFGSIDTTAFGSGEARALRSCVPLEKGLLKDKKNVGAAFAGVLTSAFELALPLTVDLADRYGTQLLALRQTLQAMHADSPLFRRWITAELRSLNLILSFTSHGRQVAPCAVAVYLQGLTRSSKAQLKNYAARFAQQTGVSLATYERLAPEFYSNANPLGALTRLEPSMVAFFVAAGLSSKNATVISSTE